MRSRVGLKQIYIFKTETTASAGGLEANVHVGVNADGTYTVSVALPQIQGKMRFRVVEITTTPETGVRPNYNGRSALAQSPGICLLS